MPGERGVSLRITRAEHVEQLLGAQVLEQVAVGAEPDGVEEVVVLLGDGEHDDLDRRELLPDDP